MSEGIIFWEGESGKTYRYEIYGIGTSFKDMPGNYIFTKKANFNQWLPVYIGETDSLKNRLPNHEKLPCVERNGGTHIHVHFSSSDEEIRCSEEVDLINKWNPSCNKE